MGKSLINIKILVLVFFILSFCAATSQFHASFPHQYSWGELLLNYQGGFTKRGLIGQIAFRSRHVVNPDVFFSVFLLLSYSLLSYVFVMILDMTKRLSSTLFLFSPTGWLWPLLVTPAFGRKDVFIVIASVSSILVSKTCLNIHRSFMVCLFCFTLIGFVIETVWFYFPVVLLTVMFLSNTENKSWKTFYMITGVCYCTLFLMTMAILPPANAGRIYASWPAVYPENRSDSVLCCLGFTVREALNMSYASGEAFGGGYILALCFGLIPILININERRMFQNRAFKAKAVALILVVVLFSFLPILITADWGRYIYLGLTVNFCCLWVSDRQMDHTDRSQPVQISIDIPKIIFIVLYATMWQTVHYRGDGNSAFIPGILFRMMGESDLPSNVD